MSYYYESESEYESSEEDYEEIEYVRKQSVDLIDFHGEVIVNGVRYDSDGDVVMAM